MLIPTDVTVIPATTGGYDVSPIWADVDRPNVGGWRVTTQRDADRLEAALRAGVVYSSTEVATDVNGATYVSGRSRVMGKYMNADLRKLGY